MDIPTIGIDLAKNSFSLHGVDSCGKTVLRKTMNRSKLLGFIAQLPHYSVGTATCSDAHYKGREFEKLGHRIGIMAPHLVAPDRKSEKNDSNDAEAICEAVERPNIRLVPVKSAEQQAVLRLVDERTALINQLRGLLTEFGIIMPVGRYSAQGALPDILEVADNQLPVLARRLLADSYDWL